ncbi:retrotransposon protein [Cucumis melo var. makuwa]|uniref:Retrotransposon protein n=1 Tax=Cucumis melo var. makuwa TaxID=1194695 RepID=A0A5A7V2N6_CUCMM|nr:retrotransposon protein [Cucumis melo var. makuwa]
MDKRIFAILCHLLRTVAGVSLTKIVDVEEMVVMFLQVLTHDNYLGVLDGTYIKVNVPTTSRPTFRTCKGKIATNVLSVCNTKGDFVYVLPGWERSAANSVPLARVAWCLKCPTNAKEYFNMKHSSTRNVIECAFGVLKGCSTILHGKSYYPLQVQCRIILACFLLHNFVNTEKTNCDDIDDVNEGDSAMTTSSRAPKHSHPAVTGLLNKLFSYYDELAYMFERDRVRGRFVETFVDVRSNEPVGYEGFDMPNRNEEFSSVYS